MSSPTKKPFSRRDFLAYGASLTAGAQLALAFTSRLAGLLPDSANVHTLRRALAVGSLSDAAYAMDAGSQMNFVHIVLIDKVQASLFQVVPGTPPNGSTGSNGAAQTASSFRNLGLTKLFGDNLQGLPDSVGFCLNNAWESGNGGHSLQNSIVSTDNGGVNHVFETLSGGSGLLGAVGFGLRSSANDSGDAFTGASGQRLKTYGSVTQLSETLSNSVAPLLGSDESRALLKSFDQLAAKNAGFRDTLLALAQKLQGALPDINSAASNKDPVAQQVQAIIALQKAGVSRNFMLAVPWDDTNGGGDLTTKGGSRNLDPFSATPAIASALVALHTAIPNLVCVSTSDGGRGQDNSDQSAGCAFLTGPASTVKTAVIGGAFKDSSQLGTNFSDIALSSGSRQVARPGNWYATALKAAGVPVSGVDYVPEALVNG